MRIPTNPLDVLAQQVVSMLAMEAWSVDDLFDLVRRSASYTQLPRGAFDATLDLLSGRYPSDEFAELRPRIVWDRVTGQLTGRPGAQRLAVTSGGTIPDRGLFGVFLVSGGEGPGRRVGELDEEMVYESRVGDVFALGATSWRIEDITHDRVLVTPAPGVPGRLPFWKGDALGRPAELGEAIGAFTRELGASSRESAVAVAEERGLDAWAAGNLVGYVHEQVEATGVLPSDRTLVVERFRDELGDWRLVVHSPYGTPVHAPWALAINARLRERYGIDGQAIASDDGIVIRIPDTDAEPPTGEVIAFEPDEIDDLVTQEVGGSALFASRFRECAARALLLPRRDPGRRSPLWQQRQRSAALLEVASKYPSFPIVLEAVRECLQDVYDLPALVGLMRRVQRREVGIHDVDTHQPSPYARSLLFGYVAQFVYEGDSPIAERRAAALALDQGLLAELLGRAELRELLDPDVLAEIEATLQRTDPERRARDAEGVADLLRWLGPLTDRARSRTAASRPARPPSGWPLSPTRAARSSSGWPARSAGRRSRTSVACATASAYRSHPAHPTRSPSRSTIRSPTWSAASPAPTARSRSADVSARLGLGVAVARQTLQRLGGQGRVLEGEFRPSGSGAEWCDAEVLRMLRRRSLARLRQEVEPVEPAAMGRFLLAWQHVNRPQRGRPRGVDGLLQVVDQLAGYAAPASAWESLILPARLPDYEPALLDELTASGEVTWVGQAALPGNDGWVSLHLGDQAPLTLPADRAGPRPRARRGPPGRPRRARSRRRVVLPPAGRGDRRHRARAGRRLVGAGLGGSRHQRHLRTAACAHLGLGHPPHPPRGAPGQAQPTEPVRRTPDAAGDLRSLGTAARRRRRPDAAGPRHGGADARATRRRHPWRGGLRAHRGRLRGGLQGAVGVRGLRPLPPGLLRRRARRCAVRYRRRRRPAAHLRRDLGGLERRTERRDEARGGHARRDRPGQPVRCCAPVARARDLGRPPTGAQGGRARRPRRRRVSRSTSNAAARRC